MRFDQTFRSSTSAIQKQNFGIKSVSYCAAFLRVSKLQWGQ